MKTIITVTIFIATSFLSSGQNSNRIDNWYQINDEEENFSILFPAPPEYKTKEINSEFGFIQGKGYFLHNPHNDNNLMYSALVTEYKGVSNYSETELNEFFNYRKRGATANMNGEVILEEKVYLNQGQGRKYRILNEEKDIIATLWCFLSGEKLYMLSVVTPRKYDNNNNVFKFLESFKITTNPSISNPYVKRFGSGGCGKILIPNDWKIHDEEWNSNIENYVGTTLITILRANDYDKTTFYIKLSTIRLNDSYTPEEIRASENEFLVSFDEVLANSINQVNSLNNEVIEFNNSRFISVGGAYGCVHDYTYINQQNEIRKTLIHQLIIGNTLYYLTISWDVNDANNPMQIVNFIREEIQLCDLN